jgi:hypothetical protein
MVEEGRVHEIDFGDSKVEIAFDFEIDGPDSSPIWSFS